MFPKFKNNKTTKTILIAFVLLFTYLIPQNSLSAIDPASQTTIGQCVEGGTLTWNSISLPGVNIGNCLTRILYFVLWLQSFLLGVVGSIFNLVFEITVVHMSENVSNIAIIDTGWVAIRDVTNILFIFMLLYLAIATILQLDEHGVKHGLSRLIIGATLINFSLFFVKVPIDVSNIVAIQIYNKINMPDSNGSRVGLGDAILSMFSPQQAFKDPSMPDPRRIARGDPNAPEWNLKKNPTTTFAMGIIVIFTATFIFLAVIVIFIKRFITLVMLMIFSPLAFAGMAIPSHDIEHEISHRFWNTLIKESFYAPVFMFLMYLTIRVGQALNSTQLAGGNSTWLDWAGTVPVTNIISYSVVIGMMIFSLTVSESMGVQGAGGAIKMFNGVRGATIGWLGANTVGRAAHTWVNKLDGSEFTKAAAGIGNSGSSSTAKLANFMATNKVARAFGSKSVAKAISGTAQGLGKSSFGGDKSYDDKIHSREQEMESALEEAHNDPKVLAKLLSEGVNDKFGKAGTSLKAVHRKFHHMSTEEKANTFLHLQDMIDRGGEVDHHTGKFTAFSAGEIEGLKKTKKALFEDRITESEKPDFQRKIAGGVDFHAEKFKELLGDEHHGPNVDGMKVFIQNATEGQMKVALKSLGDAGKKFDITDDMLPKAGDKPEVIKEKETKIQQVQELRNVISNGISKFKGESFHAAIAKDDGVALGIKDASAEGIYKAKMRFSMYSAFKGSDKNVDKVKALDNKDLREKFVSDVKVLSNMEDVIKEYDETVSKLKPTDVSEHKKAFEKVLDAYGQRNAGEETTMKYADGANADRSATKTAYIQSELEKHKQLLAQVKITTSNSNTNQNTPPQNPAIIPNQQNTTGTSQNKTTT